MLRCPPETIAWILATFLLYGGVGCTGNPTGPAKKSSRGSSRVNPALLKSAGFRVQFKFDDAYTLTNPNEYGCPGEIKTYYQPYASSSSTAATPVPFGTDSMNSSQTERPSFIRNVSLDLSNASVSDATNASLNCALQPAPTRPRYGYCAAFDYDEITGYLPAQSGFTYGTSKFYTLLDHQCPMVGIDSTSFDDEITKLDAGGVHFDIDRSALGTTENLLLHLKYFPMSVNNEQPGGSSTKWTENQVAYFKVHLMKVDQSLEDLKRVFQPRHLEYDGDLNAAAYPKIAQTLSVLSQPQGGIREEELVLPISMDSRIDRVRIERYSGSAILVEAALYRLGVP